MKKKMAATILSMIMVTVLLAGCGAGGNSTADAQESAMSGEAESTEAAPETEETAGDGGSTGSIAGDGLDTTGSIEDIKEASVKIGCSWMDLTTEYQANLQKSLIAECEQNYPNVELIHVDGGSDAANQVSQVENLVAQDVDAILMVPYDRNGCIPAVEAAASAGIPIIELCQETDSPQRTSFVGSYHYESGEIAMQALADHMNGAGKVVFLEGPIGQDSALARIEAGKAVLGNYPDIELVTEKVCDWDRAAAMAAVENIIQSGMDFDMIYSSSDSMAMGALEALKGTNKEGKVAVIGIDLIKDAMNSIKAGEMYGTAFQVFPRQATVGMEVAVRAALGEEIYETYAIPFELVTAENVAEYEWVYK